MSDHHPDCAYAEIDGHCTCHEVAERFEAKWRSLLEERDLLLRELDDLRQRLDQAHLDRIEAQNPGIDMERVREERSDEDCFTLPTGECISRSCRLHGSREGAEGGESP